MRASRSMGNSNAVTLSLGVDIGGTYAKSVLLSEGGEVCGHEAHPVPEVDVLDFVIELVGRRMNDAPVRFVGVGVAGLVAWPEGILVWGPHVAGIGVPYRQTISRRLKVATVVDNDANLAALAEARMGAGKGRDPVMMVSLGTGIGGGLVVGGEIFRGRSFAGEIGHINMIPDGAPCACGENGCWETVVSGSILDGAAKAIAAAEPRGVLAHVAAGSTLGGRHLSMAANLGDTAAQSALADAGGWLGRGIADLVSVLDPEIVVIGGAASGAGDWLLNPARQMIAKRLSGARHRPPVSLVSAELGRWSGAIGAASLARSSGGSTR